MFQSVPTNSILLLKEEFSKIAMFDREIIRSFSSVSYFEKKYIKNHFPGFNVLFSFVCLFWNSRVWYGHVIFPPIRSF